AQRLGWVLREAEIDRPREELPSAVESPRREQFLRADDAELFAELRPQDILPAVAARDGEIRRSIPVAAREVRDELRVLIVLMRRDVEHAAHFAEAFQVLKDRGAGWGVGGE